MTLGASQQVAKTTLNNMIQRFQCHANLNAILDHMFSVIINFTTQRVYRALSLPTAFLPISLHYWHGIRVTAECSQHLPRERAT